GARGRTAASGQGGGSSCAQWARAEHYARPVQSAEIARRSMEALLRRLRGVRLRAAREDGFTLIEMVISISLCAIIFGGLAFTLGSMLHTMQEQKARTLANEVATQGIEDLQRMPYSSLGLCGSPTRPNGLPAPTGFGTVIQLNCTNATTEEPCTPSTFSPALTAVPVPKESYTCTRSGTPFLVSRYV